MKIMPQSVLLGFILYETVPSALAVCIALVQAEAPFLIDV